MVACQSVFTDQVKELDSCSTPQKNVLVISLDSRTMAAPFIKVPAPPSRERTLSEAESGYLPCGACRATAIEAAASGEGAGPEVKLLNDCWEQTHSGTARASSPRSGAELTRPRRPPQLTLAGSGRLLAVVLLMSF